MIDIENDVFQMVSMALLNSIYTGTTVLPEYTESISELPAVTVVESDNNVFRRMRTENIENAVNVVYEVNVFSDKVGAKKQEAKGILSVIDDAFTTHGFTRMMQFTVPNFADSRIYRIVARYAAVVGPNGNNNYLIYQNGAT